MGKKFQVIIAITALLAAAAVYTFGSRGDILRMNATSSENQVSIEFLVSAGYGIQKEANHSITVYSLKAGHQSEKEVKAKIARYGKEIASISPVKFSGATAKEDKDYFSSVLPITLKKAKGQKEQLAIKAKIFYCSFDQGFCSQKTFRQLVR